MFVAYIDHNITRPYLRISGTDTALYFIFVLFLDRS